VSKLSIYLNDHLMGSTAAVERARLAALSNRDNEYGQFLARLAREIEEDRASLRRIMRAHGVGADRVKQALGWAGEKFGRLKLNGRVIGYSPLSRLLELELLSVGVHGKRALWRTLQADELADSRELDDLIARAERQLEEVEQHRLRAASEAFA